MAHKISNSTEAVSLMKNKAVSLDTLTSAIVRGKGFNMTENKLEFLQEYARVSNQLSDEFGFLFGRLFDEEWTKSSE